MSESFWKRLSLITGLMTLASIFGLLIFVANLEIKDLDLWLHLGVGKYIVQHNFHVPNVDILSCTIPGRPWINHEWLFQVILYLISAKWGMDGLITMQVVLVTVTMLILFFLGYNREKQLSSIFILLLVSLVYQGRFTIRPDLYSLLFFALYIFILSFYLDRRWSIYALFVIQLIWTNMHGFFFFGPLFVLIGFCAEWTKRHVKLPYEWNKIGRLTNDEYRRMKVILTVVILACLINPMGIKGAWYPIGVFFQISGDSKIFFDKIIELKRPITAANIFSTADYPFYKLLILLSALSFFYNRRKIDIGGFIFWLIFLFFSLAAVRNLIFFAFAAYLVFVTNALTITYTQILPIRLTDKRFLYMVSIFTKAMLLIWVIHFWTQISFNGYFDFDTYERKSEFGGISQRNYPIKAADFLVANKIKGDFFNDFNSGAYLVGRCYPDIRVYIDGRTEVYGPEFFRHYTDMWEKNNADIFAEELEKYHLTGVFLNSVYQPIPRDILKYLYESKEWVPVYFDYDGVIFLKDIEKNRSVIERQAIDLARWQPIELDIYRLGAKQVLPYRYANRAYTLMDMGLYGPAAAEARAALAVNPDYGPPYKILGKIYAERKQYEQAFKYFRFAAIIYPGNKKLKTNLASAYYDLGKYEYAAQEYEKIIEAWPNDPKAYYLLARTFARQARYDKALSTLQSVIKIKAGSPTDILEIGDIAFAEKAYDVAKRIYELAVQAGKPSGEAHLKLGQTYHKLGDDVAVRDQVAKGLAAEPDNEEIKKQLQELEASLAP